MHGLVLLIVLHWLYALPLFKWMWDTTGVFYIGVCSGSMIDGWDLLMGHCWEVPEVFFPGVEGIIRWCLLACGPKTKEHKRPLMQSELSILLGQGGHWLCVQCLLSLSSFLVFPGHWWVSLWRLYDNPPQCIYRVGVVGVCDGLLLRQKFEG